MNLYFKSLTKLKLYVLCLTLTFLLSNCKIMTTTVTTVTFQQCEKRKRENPETSHKYESETQPNQSYTVAELMKYHIQGIRPAIEKSPLYEMETFGDTLNPLRKPNFDLTDLDEIRDDLTKARTELSKQEENQKKQQKNQFKQQIIDEYEQEKRKQTRKNAKSIGPEHEEGN